MFRRARSVRPTARSVGARPAMIRSLAVRGAAAVLLLGGAFALHAQDTEAPQEEQPSRQSAPPMSAMPAPETTNPQAVGPGPSDLQPTRTPPSTAMPAQADPGRGEGSRVAPTGVRQRAPVQPVETEADRLARTVTGFRQEIAALQDANDALTGTNQHLNELNAQLRQEVESLALELQEIRAATDQRRMLYGAGLILFGLLAGVLIKARPRRSAWS